MKDLFPTFGKVTEEQALDSEGSVLKIETNYQNGVPRLPKYRHVEYRIRVRDSKEEMTEFLKFSDEKVGKLKSNFFTETTPQGEADGWYYVVKCWTEAVKD